MHNLKDILLEIGYSNIIDSGRELRTRPIYRDSGNNTSLCIKKSDGRFFDYSANISGSFEDLIKLSLNLKTITEAQDWLGNKLSNSELFVRVEKPLIKQPRILNKQDLSLIIPRHQYWNKRGISNETLNIFGGGVMEEGRLKDRYVFPIFNRKRELVGFAGRDVKNNPGPNRPKWKHIGDKSKWKYPLQSNIKVLQESKEVIIVESVGDMLALWENGIRNTVVVFGVNISVELLNLFIKLDLNKMIISFNNDSSNNNVGNVAADKAKNKLLKYFDRRQVSVNLPPKNDFGDMSAEEILLWRKTI